MRPGRGPIGGAPQGAPERHQKAVAFHGQAAPEAVEDRCKEVFAALTEVETCHLALGAARN